MLANTRRGAQYQDKRRLLIYWMSSFKNIPENNEKRLRSWCCSVLLWFGLVTIDPVLLIISLDILTRRPLYEAAVILDYQAYIKKQYLPWCIVVDASTSVLVTAWCHQATSHCMSQCWPRNMSSYGITRAHWFNWAECFPGDKGFVTCTSTHLFKGLFSNSIAVFELNIQMRYSEIIRTSVSTLVCGIPNFLGLYHVGA